uniref:Putative secreted protein n=1 Tax=Rhipicephalus microplus TaxID=6941 RepID=A0A6G5A2L9_RHIMP
MSSLYLWVVIWNVRRLTYQLVRSIFNTQSTTNYTAKTRIRTKIPVMRYARGFFQNPKHTPFFICPYIFINEEVTRTGGSLKSTDLSCPFLRC